MTNKQFYKYLEMAETLDNISSFLREECDEYLDTHSEIWESLNEK